MSTNEPSVTEAAQRGVATLEEATADLRDLALATARAATDTGRRTSLDDVLKAFGQTREWLAALVGDESPTK